MSLQLINTKDGSTSLYSEKFDEPYHSRHGAIQESQHVFIRMGLEHFFKVNSPQELKIFEMGFGTGLNALLTYKWAIQEKIKIEYTSIEKFPLSKKEVDAMNYVSELKMHYEIFEKIHDWSAISRFPERFSPYFDLLKVKVDLQESSKIFAAESFDLIYFDAFAPSSQPHLWEVPIFESMYRLLKPGGFLTTYCAKGQVRRNMQAAGFTVEKVSGPPGKREMLRACR